MPYFLILRIMLGRAFLKAHSSVTPYILEGSLSSAAICIPGGACGPLGGAGDQKADDSRILDELGVIGLSG